MDHQTGDALVAEELQRRRTARSLQRSQISFGRLLTLCAICAVGAALVTFLLMYTHVDWALVREVPGTFWGSFFVALFAIGGVLLTNAGHNSRARAERADAREEFELQILHDSDRQSKELASAAAEAVKERETTMRREVYLNSADALIVTQMSLGSLFNRDLASGSAMDPMLAFASANAKLMVVARPSTCEAVMELQGLYGVCYLKAIPLAIKARNLQLAADGLKDLHDHYNTEWKKLSSLVEAADPHTQAGAEDIARLSAAARRYETWRDSCAAKHIEANGVAARAKIDYQIALRPEFEVLAVKQLEVLGLLREELGLEKGIDKLQSVSKEMRARFNTEMDAYVARATGQHRAPAQS